VHDDDADVAAVAGLDVLLKQEVGAGSRAIEMIGEVVELGAVLVLDV
jgi:hypothetical protein